MFFLNPTYFWAFLGLLVPIAIHLWSKKEGRTLKIGSIQLLRESDSKQTSSIKINEWWLLLLRLLIISLIVIILAEPRLKQQVNTVPITYMVEPDLLDDIRFAKVLDSLKEDQPIHLFQSGFPEWDEDEVIAENETPLYWQLARQLETFPSDSLVVYTTAKLSGIKGIRPVISKNINWVFIEPEIQNSIPVAAISKEDKLEVIYAENKDATLGFNKEELNKDRLQITRNADSVEWKTQGGTEVLALQQVNPIKIQLFYSPETANERRYLKATLGAISEYLEVPVEIYETQQTDSLDKYAAADLIWLSENPLPETSQKTLIFRPNSLAGDIIEPGPSAGIWHLTAALNAENIIERQLAEKLLDFLDPYQATEKAAVKYDKRIMDREEFIPNVEENISSIERSENTNISHWFWFALFPILIGERFLSKYRKQ